MTNTYFFQIMDSLTEKVISTFIGPSERFAENVFYNFITSDKMNNADLTDLFLVKCRDGKTFESYQDYCNNFDSDADTFLWYGNDLLLFKEKKHES